jgi:hypothetical protein
MNPINSTPEVFYGSHMLPGCAEYRPPGQEPFRVFLNEETIKEMDSSFKGKPLYVGHAEGKEVLSEADGWVVESFYLPEDGKHWCKFLAVTDRAKDAIRQGRRLSNAYTPKAFGPKGLWNGIEYSKEITEAQYDHLALVPDPRYDESIVLTPEKFKKYCEEKRMELAKVANSIDEKQEVEEGDNTMAFWKKTKVENSLELESTMVDLPKSKTQVDLKTLINEADDYRLEMKLPKMANEEHHVQVGKGDSAKQMTVGELRDCYNSMMDEKSKMEEEKKKNDAESEERDAAEEEKKAAMKKDGKEKAMNAEEDEEKKKKEEEEKKKNKSSEEDTAKKMNELKLFNELKNAHLTPIHEERTPDIGMDRVNRGKTRYGSSH